MRFASAVFAFVASLAFASAQDLSGIPSCAIPCFATAIPGSGCSISDAKCQCSTGRDAITKSLMSCAPDKCSTDEIAKLAPAVQSYCASASVTVSDIPTAASSASSSAASTSMSGSKTASASMSGSSTGSSAPTQTTNAAQANVVGLSAVAMGLAAGVFGL